MNQSIIKNISLHLSPPKIEIYEIANTRIRVPHRLMWSFFALVGVIFVLGSSGANADKLERGPYLQQGSSDSVIIKWRSEDSTDSQIKIGTDVNNLSDEFSNTQSTTEHEVKVTGLDPLTRYYYSVGSSSGVLSGASEGQFFQTSPLEGEAAKTRIWVIGDAGTANSNQRDVYQAYQNFTGNTYTNLWLMLGDNAYDDGEDHEYQKAVFDMYPEILRQSPLWATLGNHDGHSADSSSESGPYYDIFSLPRQGEVGGVASGTEAFYSFNYSNIHFVVLDSYKINSGNSAPMAEWLKSDLQDVSADWLVAFWHHPPYSKGSHDSDKESELIEMRETFLPILEDYGVDLVLNGHSHSYERSKFINGHYGKSDSFNSSHVVEEGSGCKDCSNSKAYEKTSTAGAVYAVAGASGKISSGSFDHPAMYVSLKKLGSMVIDVNGLSMDVIYLNNNGSVLDKFTISKGSVASEPPKAPSNFAAMVTPSNLVQLSWVDNADNESKFELQRSGDGQNWLTIASPGVNSTQYSDDNLAANTIYFYQVRAVNNVGSSNYSNVVSITTADIQPSYTVEFQNGVDNYNGTEDSYIASGSTSDNYGSKQYINADGSDGSDGELVSLVKWDIGRIPSNSTVKAAEIKFDVFNASSGSYRLYAMKARWQEGDVTWRSANIGSNQGLDIGTLTPNNKGTHRVTLNERGIEILQTWVNDANTNFGLIARSTGTSDGVDIRSSEYGSVNSRPSLTVTYDSGTTETTPPVSPSNLTAVRNGSITLNWLDNSDNETSFEIERSRDGSSWVTVGLVDSDETHFVDANSDPKITYYYRVFAKNNIGSSVSNIIIVDGLSLPGAPTNLELAFITQTIADFYWQDQSDNESGFRIERRTDNNDWETIADVGAGVSQYIDTGLIASTSYDYRVRAVNAAGESEASNILNATTTMPPNETTLTFQDGTNNYQGTEDSYIARGQGSRNFSDKRELEADGSDGSKKELIALLKWDISAVPSGVTVTDASITLHITNRSDDDYGLYTMNGYWGEHDVTWYRADVGANQGSRVALFNPTSNRAYTISIDTALVQGWLDGSIVNNGILVRTEGTKDGIIFPSSEYQTTQQRPMLSVSYQ